MTITDNLAAITPVLLSAPAALSGDISMDILSNLSIVGAVWYFYKKTEQKNEKIEDELRQAEKAHKKEIKEERETFKELLEQQQVATADNINKITILQESSEQRAEERYNALLERLLTLLDR